MPFRWMLKEGGAQHPVGYALVMLAAGMLVSMVVAVYISIQASERAVQESERRQCEDLYSEIRGYQEVPPVSDAGKEQLRAKSALYKTWGCPIPEEGK